MTVKISLLQTSFGRLGVPSLVQNMIVQKSDLFQIYAGEGNSRAKIIVQENYKKF